MKIKRKDKPLTFTSHQLKRMSKRGISKLIVEIVVGHGDWRRGKNPFSFQVDYKGIVIILYEDPHQYFVSTCKLNREYTLKAEKISRDQEIDYWKAVHRIIKRIDFTDEVSQILNKNNK